MDRSVDLFFKLYGKYLSVIFVVILMLLGLFIINSFLHPAPSSYEDCVAQGHMVLNSYPPQCQAGNKTFVKNP
jgi:hypothetical protein